MSLTTKNQLLIAFKKLVGKAHTNSQFGSANESVASSVQLDSSTIFSQPIPSAPSSSLYSITNNVVEKIQFSLASISLAQYTAVGAAGGGITMDGDGAPGQGTFSNGIHAYSLKLPTDYQVSSSNPKKGTSVYVNGQSLTASNGLLQIVPERYGSLYPASVSSSTGILAALDEEDYILDPYAGILFVQDINRVPTSVTAYVYIGDYLNQTVSGTTAQFTTITGSTITGSNALFTTITGSHSGSGAGLYNITASGINNFTADVRGQFSAGTGIAINSGVISASNIPNASLQNSSITIGTTNIALGATSTALAGITSLTASNAFFQGDVRINGTASIAFLQTINEQSLKIGDKYIFILSGGVDHATLDGSGIQWGSGAIGEITQDEFGSMAHVRYDAIKDKISIFPGLYVSGATGTEISGGLIVTGSTILGTLSGTTAQFTDITGSLFGNASTVTSGVYTSTISSHATTGIIAGNGLSGGGTVGVLTLNIGGGDGVTINSNGIAVNSTVVRTSGSQSITGEKTFIDYITGSITGSNAMFITITGSTVTGSTALFESITGSFSGSGRNITLITASNISNFTNDVRTQFSAGTNITIVGGVISSTASGSGGSGSGTPGGTNTTVQFNSGSTFSGSNNLIYNYTTNTLSGTLAQFTNITASFTGSAAGLYNLTASGINNFTADVRGQFSAGTNITIVGGVISSTASGSGGSGSATPGGTDTTVQFNSGSTFSGSTNLIYNYTTNILSGTLAQFTNITASFTGSGVGLYNITASGINNFTNDVRGQFSAGTNVSIVGGVISAAGGGGGNLTTLNVSTDYLLQSTDAYIFTSGTLTLTIPSAIGSAGKLYYIKNTSTGTITLTGSLSQTIDGYTDIVIEDKNTMLGLASDGANWTIF